MFIFPANKLQSANGDYASIDPKLTITFDESKLYLEDGFYYANGVISNVYLQNTIIDFIGVGFVAETVEGQTEYEYSTFVESSNARSVLSVATGYYNSGAVAYKDLVTTYIEKAIYAKYGVTESRPTEDTVVFKVGENTYSSYEEMKLANPITLSLSVDKTLSVGAQKTLKTIAKVNGQAVDIAIPVAYEITDGLTLTNNTLKAISVGEQNVTATFAGYTASVNLTVYYEVDGIVLDGVRDSNYGDFKDTVIMSDGRYYNISAVKTTSGVVVYSVCIFFRCFPSVI